MWGFFYSVVGVVVLVVLPRGFCSGDKRCRNYDLGLLVTLSPLSNRGRLCIFGSRCFHGRIP